MINKGVRACPDCGALLPAGVTQCWSCHERPAHSTSQTSQRINSLFLSVLGILFGTLLVIGALTYLFYTFFYAPTHTATTPPTAKRPSQQQTSLVPVNPEQAVLAAISIELPYAESRLEFLQGANLNIYLKRQDFERILFPDRSDAVTRIGKAWCDNVEGIFLPTLKIRDIRTGEQLAKYSCTTGSVSIPERN